VYERLGRAAISFSLVYLRRRYRRQIRLGVGVVAIAIGIAAYFATRNVPEG
jgi:hypothetical protein